MLVPKFKQGERVIWTHNNTDTRTHELVEILERPLLNVEMYEAGDWRPWLDRKEVIYLIRVVDKNFGEVLFVAENVLKSQSRWVRCLGEHRFSFRGYEKKVEA